jgi:hypothetical protein
MVVMGGAPDERVLDEALGLAGEEWIEPRLLP